MGWPFDPHSNLSQTTPSPTCLLFGQKSHAWEFLCLEYQLLKWAFPIEVVKEIRKITISPISSPSSLFWSSSLIGAYFYSLLTLLIKAKLNSFIISAPLHVRSLTKKVNILTIYSLIDQIWSIFKSNFSLTGFNYLTLKNWLILIYMAVIFSSISTIMNLVHTWF